MRRRLVVRYPDGRVEKGYSPDFYPTAERFQLVDRFTNEPTEVRLADLKAVFFVRSFDTDGLLRQRDDIERVGLGRKLRVRFADGEEMVGFSTTYSRDRRTFVLVPGDPDSNHEKVVVVTRATESVEIL